ncbi:MAG: aldose 1-epimerase family protein [Planctomycetaceae bacterium]
MPTRSYIIYDADQPQAVSDLTHFDQRSTGQTLAGGDDWSIDFRKLRGGTSEGVEVVDLCSGPLTVSVLPTRGMGLWRGSIQDEWIGWDSPVWRPVHPQFVNLAARNGLGWLDGFNELLCRCGLSFNGPPGIDEGAKSPIESQLTLHGLIANKPAHSLEVTIDDAGEGRVAVTGVIDEATVFGPQLRLTSTVSVIPGRQEIEIEDTIENLAGSEAELELLYHINVGRPFLGAGSRLCAPVGEIAPRDGRAAEGIDEWDTYLGPTTGYSEQAYFMDLRNNPDRETSVLLANAAGDRGFRVRWSAATLPCFTVWKCTQDEADGYVTGLEPGTNYPNFKSFERDQGRVRRLSPGGGSYTTSISIGICTTTAAVDAERAAIAAIAGDKSPVIHTVPTHPYSPV